MLRPLAASAALSLPLSACFGDLDALRCEDPRAPGCGLTEGTAASTSAASSSGPGDAGSSSSGTASSEGSTDTTNADASSTTSDASSTTAVAGVCGDGVVDPGEECDGEDACNSLCVRDRLVFASSELFAAGKIGGLGGADTRCKLLAFDAGLPRAESFRAWLSSTTEDPAGRFFRSPGRYVLVNGLVVADDWDELTSGTLQRPIDADELAGVAVGSVWTGTLPDGTRRPGTSHCGDWTDELAVDGYKGVISEYDADWTMAGDGFLNPYDCLDMLALYCFEQE